MIASNTTQLFGASVNIIRLPPKSVDGISIRVEMRNWYLVSCSNEVDLSGSLMASSDGHRDLLNLSEPIPGPLWIQVGDILH